MSAFDSAAAEAQGIDPILQNNLGDVSTKDPLLPKNKYTFEVVKVSQTKTNDGKGNLLKIQLKTLEDATSVDGQPIPAGRTIFHQISLTPTPKYTTENIQRNLKRFQVALVPNFSGQMFPLEQWVGLQGTLSLGFSKATDEYPEVRNEVKGFEEKKAS